MFSSLPIGPVPILRSRPRDVPPATPINFPRFHPQVLDDEDDAGAVSSRDNGDSGDSRDSRDSARRCPLPLTKLLQGIVRPTEVAERHFAALGVHVTPEAAPELLIPDMSVVPDFSAWEALTYEQAGDANQASRVRISNGNMSPGVQAFHDRRRELSAPNEAAFRAVRRIQPLPGQTQARLGNSFEFFRNLDALSTFWDDTSAPPAATPAGSGSRPEQQPAAGSGPEPGPGHKETEAGESDTAASAPEPILYRSGSGSQMPPEIRLNITTAFLKLVAYDFGCNVAAPRAEPRLYLNSPSVLVSEDNSPAESGSSNSSGSSGASAPATPKPSSAVVMTSSTASASAPPSTTKAPSAAPLGPSSYFNSGCTFIFRTPTTREAARAGIVEGPLAAVSARHTTTFPAPNSSSSSSSSSSSADKESILDLAREIVAALLTAQHRAREGRTERRVGEDAWWATKRRWGGGEGGPIGREVDLSSATSTSDGTGGKSSRSRGAVAAAAAAAAAASETSSGPPAEGIVTRPIPVTASGGSSSSSNSSSKGDSNSTRLNASLNALNARFGTGRKSPHHHPVPPLSGPGPRSKSRRTTLPVYDNYRMVRPPSSAWDKKARYSAIGRVPGADYDDIFVVSALFHHMAVLRVRVPLRLLEVLDGAPEDSGGSSSGGGGGGMGRNGNGNKRSWGRLEVFRSPWYDFFLAGDRVKAMKLVWAMMAFMMRKVEDGDVKMAGT